MAITNFQRTVWSKKIQTALETVTGLKNHSDYQFEGEIKYAKEVKILGVNMLFLLTKLMCFILLSIC